MKTKAFKTTGLFLFLLTQGATLMAQENQYNYLLTYEGKNGTRTLGLFGELHANGTTVDQDPAVWLGYRIGLIFNGRFSIGAAGYGLGYEREFSAAATPGTYHLEAGYAGMFLDYRIPVTQRLGVNFSLVSAAGIARYKYDKASAADLPWYEEVIDRDNFGVFEPGIGLNYRLGDRWAVGLQATYRHTAPINLEGANEQIFNTFNAGISIRYGIF